MTTRWAAASALPLGAFAAARLSAVHAWSAGLVNREIAGRLVLLVRTVDGHLYRPWVSLGASDRIELGAFLGGTDSRPDPWRRSE